MRTRGSASSSVAQSDELLPAEKLEILDGQALQLRGLGAAAERRSCRRDHDALRARRREACRRARRQGRFDRVDARADSRRPRRDRRSSRSNAAEAEQLYRHGVALLEAELSRLRGAAQRQGAARRLSRAQRPGSRRPRRCSARSSIRRPIPATCRRPSRTCFSLMSTSCSRRATTRRRPPKSSPRPS